MKRAAIVVMNVSTLLLACLCTSAIAADPPFKPLLDHVARQNGNWNLDKPKAAAVFYRCMDAISKDKEKAVVEFVGNDNERAYWIGYYLTDPSCLHDRAPLSHLALSIWANASDRLAMDKELNDGEKAIRHSLNYIAAIQAKRLGLDAMAAKLKRRVGADRGAGSPVVSADDSRLYGSVKTPKSKRRAKAEEDGTKLDPLLVLRTYDISDLSFEASTPPKKIDELGDGRTSDSVNMQPLPAMMGQGMGVMGGGKRPGPSAGAGMGGGLPEYIPYSQYSTTKRNENDQLVDAITQHISPTDWDNVGGPSSLQVLGDLLVVRTTTKNHRQIAAFLDTIRQRAAAWKMVSVEVHWLWLSEDELHRIAPTAAEKDNKRPAACLIVDDAAWNRLAKERAAEDNDVRAGYHAIISCLNGQTVVAAAGRQSRVIVTMIPVVGDPQADPTPHGTTIPPSAVGPPAPAAPATTPAPAAAAAPNTFFGPSARGNPPNETTLVGYQPSTTTIQEGPAVEIRPILCPGDKILLDVHSRVIELQTTTDDAGAAPAKRPAANQPANVVRDLAAVVDRPNMSTHRIDTTLRAPLGRRVLVGGITFGTEPEAGNRSLYVFIEGVACDPPDAAPKAKR